GALPDGGLRRRGGVPRKGDRASARGPDDQRPSGRCVLADRPARRGALPVAPRLAVRPAGKRSEADRGQARKRPQPSRRNAARRLSRAVERRSNRLLRRQPPLTPTLPPPAGRGRDPREAWEGEGRATREPT